MDRINEILNSYKIPLGLCFVGLVLVLGGLFFSDLTAKPKEQKNFPSESLVQPKSEIKVNISGAIQNPGVYSLNSTDRVEDVIKMSGGFSEDVNQEYISKVLNLSQKISDGMKIYIPFDGESQYVQSLVGQVAGATTTKVGLNTSSSKELEDLPGIGPVTAGKIIGSRPYNDVNDLLIKKAVSKSVFEKIKDQVDLH